MTKTLAIAAACMTLAACSGQASETLSAAHMRYVLACQHERISGGEADCPNAQRAVSLAPRADVRYAAGSVQAASQDAAQPNTMVVSR